MLYKQISFFSNFIIRFYAYREEKLSNTLEIIQTNTDSQRTLAYVMRLQAVMIWCIVQDILYRIVFNSITCSFTSLLFYLSMCVTCFFSKDSFNFFWLFLVFKL